MIRLLHFSFLLMAITAGVSVSIAQEPAPTTTSNQEDIRAMRVLLEQQTLKIDALSQQVAKLTQQLEVLHGTTPAQSQATPQPVVRAEAAAKPEVKPVAEAPRAEPVTAPGLTHVVARGETLTSIAKHYKTSVADLLKANKIEDDRKLQIGQILIIPSPKDSESTTTKKEID